MSAAVTHRPLAKAEPAIELAVVVYRGAAQAHLPRADDRTRCGCVPLARLEKGVLVADDWVCEGCQEPRPRRRGAARRRRGR